ncbi:MAG: hypothetical protein K2X26_06905 [Chitinophagaceae bacterium]|nr:hypothetical protein [Chitinophagaceae bacterium]
MTTNPYYKQICDTLPRLLSLFDKDKTSVSYGMGDRYYWAWGLIDFGNGTFQGAAHGMARLWKNGLWPYKTSKEKFIDRIDSMFLATKTLQRKDGSLEEAFPNEGSYCVTALVAYDLLCTIDLLSFEIDISQKQKWMSIVKPMVDFLVTSNETHAIISNHLATAVAALNRWHLLTADTRVAIKMRALLDRILKHQSSEGWFEEYGGADPGYQSLCTYYLADAHTMNPDLGLLEPLRRSICFLWCFAHPDGSFGGLYGARCTRFFYPAGFEALAPEIPEAKALSDFMLRSIGNMNTVTLMTIDECNLIPMFNSYCWSVVLRSRYLSGQEIPELPCMSLRGRLILNDSGLLIDAGRNYYTIVNIFKGGVVMHFKDGALAVDNGGVIVKNKNGKLGSTQSLSKSNPVELIGNTVKVKTILSPMPKQLPSPLQFLILRILSLTIFRVNSFREWTKQMLVKLLITRRKLWSVSNLRTITLGYDLLVRDELTEKKGYTRIVDTQYFVSIHMASQGYWQMQDEF